MTITQALEKLEKLDPQSALEKAVNETITQYEDLNRSQLIDGKLRTGADLMPPYSILYSEVRERAGLQIDHVDLKFSGAFYKGFTAEVQNETIKLGSDVEYEEKLTQRYSKDIWALTDENMNKYRQLVKPLILAESKAQFNG